MSSGAGGACPSGASRAGGEMRPADVFKIAGVFMAPRSSSFQLMKVKSHFNGSTMLSGQLGEIKIKK